MHVIYSLIFSPFLVYLYKASLQTIQLTKDFTQWCRSLAVLSTAISIWCLSWALLQPGAIQLPRKHQGNLHWRERGGGGRGVSAFPTRSTHLWTGQGNNSLMSSVFLCLMLLSDIHWNGCQIVSNIFKFVWYSNYFINVKIIKICMIFDFLQLA